MLEQKNLTYIIMKKFIYIYIYIKGTQILLVYEFRKTIEKLNLCNVIIEKIMSYILF